MPQRFSKFELFYTPRFPLFFLVGMLILAVMGNMLTDLLKDRDLALVGDFLAHDHAEDGGLAGAVGAHEADLFAGVQLEAGFHVQHLAAVLLAHIREMDHRAGDSTIPAARFAARAAAGARRRDSPPTGVSAVVRSGRETLPFPDPAPVAPCSSPGGIPRCSPVSEGGVHDEVASNPAPCGGRLAGRAAPLLDDRRGRAAAGTRCHGGAPPGGGHPGAGAPGPHE